MNTDQKTIVTVTKRLGGLPPDPDEMNNQRAGWATWHVQNGTPLEVLQKLGGWSDLRMVMNYAHHSPGYLASFVNNTMEKP